MKILGNVLVHRLLKKPSFVYDQPIPVDISYLETAVGFDEVRSAILSNTSGYMSVNISTQQVSNTQKVAFTFILPIVTDIENITVIDVKILILLKSMLVVCVVFFCPFFHNTCNGTILKGIDILFPLIII